MRERLLRAAPLLLLIVFVAWRALDWSPAPEIRRAGFDLMQETVPRNPDASRVPVRVIEIDDESRRRIGPWPWPRTILARLVQRLRMYGVRVVAFDMVFEGPDRMSPESILPFWPDTPETAALRARLGDLPSHDRIFADALASGNGVLAFRTIGRPTERLPDLKGRIEGDTSAALRFLGNAPGALNNITLLEAAAAGNGARNWSDRSDEEVRRVPLIVRVRDSLYPSFAAEIVRVHLDAPALTLEMSDTGGGKSLVTRRGFSTLHIGSISVPTDERGNLLLYFAGEESRPSLPAWQVLEAGYIEDELREGVAIISFGGELASATDRRQTALGDPITLAEAQAQAVEQILSGAFLVRSDLAPAIEIGYLLIAGLLLIVIVARAPMWVGVLSFLLLFALPVAASWRLFAQHHMLVDAIYADIALALVFLTAVSRRVVYRFWRRFHLRTLFGHSLSPNLVEHLSQHQNSIVTDGETRTLTLIYADIRGFANLVGRRGPREALRLINLYLTPVSETILDNRGMIDKFMGDSVMAFWNAPLDDPGHARNACQAALGIGRVLERMNAQRRQRTSRMHHQFAPVEASIGIVTDRFYVGEIGSDHHREYSVLGASTEIAVHLEAQSKYYGVSVLISEDTWKQVPEFATLELDLIIPPDETGPVRVYALLGDEERAATREFQQLAEAHGDMLRAYRSRQWAEALEASRRCIEISGDELSELYERYAGRIRSFQRQPPPDAWDGVYRPNGSLPA